MSVLMCVVFLLGGLEFWVSEALTSGCLACNCSLFSGNNPLKSFL